MRLVTVTLVVRASPSRAAASRANLRASRRRLLPARTRARFCEINVCESPSPLSTLPIWHSVAVARTPQCVLMKECPHIVGGFESGKLTH